MKKGEAMVIEHQIVHDRRAISLAISCFEKVLEQADCDGALDIFSAAELADFFIRFVEDYYFSAHLLTEDTATRLKRIHSLRQTDDILERIKQGQSRTA